MKCPNPVCESSHFLKVAPAFRFEPVGPWRSWIANTFGDKLVQVAGGVISQPDGFVGECFSCHLISRFQKDGARPIQPLQQAQPQPQPRQVPAPRRNEKEPRPITALDDDLIPGPAELQ